MKISSRFKMANPRTFLVCLLLFLATIEMLGQRNWPYIDSLRQNGRYEISVLRIERWAWHPIGGGQWDASGGIRVRYFGFIRVVHSKGLL